MTVEHNTKKLLLKGVGAYRVVDLETFNRLHADRVSYRRMARQLAIPLTNIQRLVQGKHWQQQPEKVVLFNEFHGTSIDIETGIAPASVLEQLGTKANERRGIAKADALVIPEDADTGWLVDQMTNILARILVKIDDDKIAQANLRECAKTANPATT